MKTGNSQDATGKTKRKVFCFAVCVLLLALCSSVEAQNTKKVARIGFLPSVGDASNPGTQITAFQQGLRDLGYIEGKNILVEYRYGAGPGGARPQPSCRTRATKVDVLVVGSPGTVQEAKRLAE